MIRINLIGQRARVKPTVGKGQLVIFVAFLVIEAVFLFVWHQKLSGDLTDAVKRSKEASTKIEELKRVKDAWEQWQTQKADLDRQAQVFESLRAEQSGPPNVLEYLGYMLTKVPDVPSAADEMKAQELVGWDPRWDPRRVWITRYLERGGVVTLSAQAIDHEDVAEFYRRLETSDYFTNVDPGAQVRLVNGQLDTKYVDFSVTGVLNYRVDLEPPAPPPDPGVAAK